jgi:hypothetical protein
VPRPPRALAKDGRNSVRGGHCWAVRSVRPHPRVAGAPSPVTPRVGAALRAMVEQRDLQRDGQPVPPRSGTADATVHPAIWWCVPAQPDSSVWPTSVADVLSSDGPRPSTPRATGVVHRQSFVSGQAPQPNVREPRQTSATTASGDTR